MATLEPSSERRPPETRGDGKDDRPLSHSAMLIRISEAQSVPRAQERSAPLNQHA
jgi:hypothetical protein